MPDTRINAKKTKKNAGCVDSPTISRNNVQKFYATIAKSWGIWQLTVGERKLTLYTKG